MAEVSVPNFINSIPDELLDEFNDRLVFGTGIGDSELWFSRSGNDLLVQVLGDDGQIQVRNWYASSSYRNYRHARV